MSRWQVHGQNASRRSALERLKRCQARQGDKKDQLRSWCSAIGPQPSALRNKHHPVPLASRAPSARPARPARQNLSAVSAASGIRHPASGIRHPASGIDRYGCFEETTLAHQAARHVLSSKVRPAVEDILEQADLTTPYSWLPLLFIPTNASPL